MEGAPRLHAGVAIAEVELDEYTLEKDGSQAGRQSSLPRVASRQQTVGRQRRQASVRLLGSSVRKADRLGPA